MTKARLALACLALASLALAACRGKVAGTAELAGPGTVTTQIVAHGPIRLWADTDVSWTGPKNSKPLLEYELDLKQNGKDAGHLQCSTSDRGGTSICGSHTNVMGAHNADCEISLDCEFPHLTGEVEIKVTGRTGANVKAVKKMSLNFRTQ